MDHDINVLLKTLNCQIREVDAIYYKIATSFRLSESAFWIMYILADTGQKFSQLEISQKLSISKQTVNSAIQSLVQKDYIVLERSFISSRRKNVRMTNRGKCFVKEHIVPLQNAEREAFIKMNHSDQEQYVNLAQTYISNLQAEINQFLQLYKTDCE